MSSIVSYIIARLKEPSTYAGIGTLLALFHVAVSSDTLVAIGGGLAAVLAIVVPQVKS